MIRYTVRLWGEKKERLEFCCRKPRDSRGSQKLVEDRKDPSLAHRGSVAPPSSLGVLGFQTWGNKLSLLKLLNL